MFTKRAEDCAQPQSPGSFASGSPFNYAHHVYRDAADDAKARSDGHCQICGRKLPLEAHHWARRYLPAHETTADALTGLCRTCHIKAHIAAFFENAGGSPEVLCAALSESVATLLLHGGTAGLPGSPMRVGWAVRVEGQWAALVSGESRPRSGEVFAFFMQSRREWRIVVVTDVLDGQPGCWRVRKRWSDCGDRLMCLNAGRAEQSAPAALRQVAA